jgi:hypothetical protein
VPPWCSGLHQAPGDQPPRRLFVLRAAHGTHGAAQAGRSDAQRTETAISVRRAAWGNRLREPFRPPWRPGPQGLALPFNQRLDDARNEISRPLWGGRLDSRFARPQTAVLAAFSLEFSADSETVAAAAAASLAGTAGSGAVRAAAAASVGRSGRCWAAAAAGIPIPLNGLAGDSEAAGGRGVGLSRILIVFYSN